MCGIVGFIIDKKSNNDFLHNYINKMSRVLHHRGPDNSGIWVDNNLGLALGHTRLAIQDLSEAGNQPMISNNNRFIIIFNGEIYNHLDLRKELYSKKQHYSWKGHSDTETIIACLEFWGIDKTLRALKGMFAIAIWDLINKEIYLSRDIMGEKPLYFGWGKDVFYFASELKALKEHPYFIKKINNIAVKSLMEFSYIKTPYSIFQNIYKLYPGTVLKGKIGINKDVPVNYPKINYDYNKFKIYKWWSFKNNVINIKKFHSNKKEIKAQFKSSFKKIILSQLISDTSVGTFLSGGIDSSLIASFMKEVSLKKFDSFTIGFEDINFNEADKAKEISNHLGIKNNQLYVTGQDMLNVIPQLNSIYDEPFADSSQLPTYLLSKFASNYVKVVLSGDGGDELFGGYNRYILVSKIWGMIRFLPYSLRKSIAFLLLSLPVNALNFFQNFLNLILSEKKSIRRLGEKIHKLAFRLNTVKNYEDFYKTLIIEWDYQEIMQEHFFEGEYSIDYSNDLINSHNSIENMMYWDSISYLPDDILTKVDRASMASSLETRAPFLSVDMINLAWSIPNSFKFKGLQGKYILREILKDYVPQRMFDFPKMGFGIPLGDWLRGPLKDWSMDLLYQKKVRESGILNYQCIDNIMSDHLNGKINYHTKIWPVLMFHSWYVDNF